MTSDWTIQSQLYFNVVMVRFEHLVAPHGSAAWWNLNNKYILDFTVFILINITCNS